MYVFYLSPEGDQYRLGEQFTYDGRAYIGSVSTFAFLGFTEVIAQPIPSQTYYIVDPTPNNDGTWNYVARPLAEVQEALIQNNHVSTLATLSGSDWYVIRQVENATPVPVEYTNYRQAVRDAFSEYESLVSAAPDVETIESDIGSTVDYPPAPGNGGITNVYIQQFSGNDYITVLGTADPENPGSFIPLTEAQFTQFGVGMYANSYGSNLDGFQIIEVLPVTAQLRLNNPAPSSDTGLRYTWDWVDYDDPIISGTINTTRDGNILYASYYLTFDSSFAGVTESSTYLFQPSTSTYIPYNPTLPSPGFAYTEGCFNGSDFTIQIKFGVRVIDTITIPSGGYVPVPFST